MNNVSFGNQDHFFSLVDALSSIRVLTQLPIEKATERVFLRQALDSLVAHQSLGQCSIFLSDGTHLTCAVGAGADTFGDDNFRQPEIVSSMTFAVDEGIMGLAFQTTKSNIAGIVSSILDSNRSTEGRCFMVMVHCYRCRLFQGITRWVCLMFHITSPSFLKHGTNIF